MAYLGLRIKFHGVAPSLLEGRMRRLLLAHSYEPKVVDTLGDCYTTAGRHVEVMGVKH